MRIAISASGKTLDSEVNPRLGRCEYFVIYNNESGETTAVENTGRHSVGAAGIATTKILNDLNVDAVLTGNVGPNAYTALEAAGITIYTGASGKVKDTIEQFRQNKLVEAKCASVGPQCR